MLPDTPPFQRRVEHLAVSSKGRAPSARDQIGGLCFGHQQKAVGTYGETNLGQAIRRYEHRVPQAAPALAVTSSVDLARFANSIAAAARTTSTKDDPLRPKKTHLPRRVLNVVP